MRSSLLVSIAILASSAISGCSSPSTNADANAADTGTVVDASLPDTASPDAVTLPPCPCFAGDCQNCYCGSAVNAYAAQNNCAVPAATAHANDLLSCQAGMWRFARTCVSGACGPTGSGLPDQCVQPNSPLIRVFFAYDPAAARCQSSTDAMMACVADHTDFNARIHDWVTAPGVVFAGSTILGESCLFDVDQQSMDADTFTCVENQANFELRDNDVLMLMTPFSVCDGGRNHWDVQVPVRGVPTRLRLGLGFTGADCACQTLVAFHEVFEGIANPWAADCCNDGQPPCTGTPTGAGIYEFHGCGGTYRLQSLPADATNAFDPPSCVRLATH